MPFVSHVDAVALTAYINNPNGDIYRDLRRRANRVLRASRQMVGTDTGALKRSLRTSVVVGPTPTVAVGSELDYAYMHHEGTRRHVIRPHLRTRLKFKVRGRIVYATAVVHPGTRPNPYLTVPLARYARG